MRFTFFSFALLLWSNFVLSQTKYPWLTSSSVYNISSISCPESCQRISNNNEGFANWLQGFPMVEKFRAVLLYNGKPKNRQDVHYRVLNIDVGNADLQQCADAVIRLRAEYLYSKKYFDSISFHFTNGFNADWNHWRKGYRIQIKNNRCNWVLSSSPDDSYACFKKYLKIVFTYCGTYSLNKEMFEAKGAPKAGMVYIQSGFPGHAVIIMDVCQNLQSGKYYVLLAQSYMPAQEIHLLKNLQQVNSSPWFLWNADGSMQSPEWSFPPGSLKQFNR